MNKNWGRKAILFIPLIAIGITAFIWVIMLLWNWLMPDIFQLPEITYWQAAGLFILSRILFGGSHFGGPKGKPNFKERKAMKEKMMQMTDEERAEFKAQFKNRCGQ